MLVPTPYLYYRYDYIGSLYALVPVFVYLLPAPQVLEPLHPQKRGSLTLFYLDATSLPSLPPSPLYLQCRGMIIDTQAQSGQLCCFPLSHSSSAVKSLVKTDWPADSDGSL